MPGPVEVHLSLVDGSVHRFRQNDFATFAKFLPLLQPAKVFGQTQIVIAGPRSIHGFHCSQVERIDLIVDSLPDYWTMPPFLVQTEEITRIEFEQIVGLDPNGGLASRNGPEGEIVQSYVEFEFQSGNRAHVRYHIRTRSAIEQRNTIQHLLTQGTMWFRRADKGYALVNVANLGRYSIFPGPPNPPATAWLMEKI